MSHTSRSRTRIVVTLGIALVATACSLLVNTDKDQCTSDGDCAKPAVCRQGVCTLSEALFDGSSDGPSDGPNGPDGDAGCTPKVPVSDEDFLNEKCTSAQCIDFDNCARLGVCDGSLPPLVTPPVGGI